MIKIHKEIIYRDCKIYLEKEQALGGWEQWYWSIYDKDGLEISSSFSESNDTLRVMIDSMKSIVDDYYKHPEYYRD